MGGLTTLKHTNRNPRFEPQRQPPRHPVMMGLRKLCRCLLIVIDGQIQLTTCDFEHPRLKGVPDFKPNEPQPAPAHPLSHRGQNDWMQTKHGKSFMAIPDGWWLAQAVSDGRLYRFTPCL